METLRSNVNSLVNYPKREIMELFLKIGYKKELFDTVDIKGKIGNSEKIYKNVNAISTLAVICDYLGQTGNEKQKQFFLDELEKNDNNFYKKMGIFALDIIEKKGNLSSFSQSLIQSNRKTLQGLKSDIRCFPTLSPSCLPNRYNKVKANRIIHEEFESELARLKGVSEGADKIQANLENHTFDRGDNSKEINDLENQL